jgi:colicin import membrane protein
MRAFKTPPFFRQNWQSISLSLLVHLILFMFLWFHVTWRNQKTLPLEAELWSPPTTSAATSPATTPIAEVKETPIKKILPPPPPAPKTEVVKTPKPEIITKKEKPMRPSPSTQEKQDKVAEEKIRKAQAQEEEKLKQRHEENLQRLLKKSTQESPHNNNTSNNSINSNNGAGNPQYIAQIAARIKSNTNFTLPNNLKDNPTVEYEVSLLPDGSIRRVIKKKSSALPLFDEAVLRAIEKSAPYPPDKFGKIPSNFTISHRPKDE